MSSAILSLSLSNTPPSTSHSFISSRSFLYSWANVKTAVKYVPPLPWNSISFDLHKINCPSLWILSYPIEHHHHVSRHRITNNTSPVQSAHLSSGTTTTSPTVARIFIYLWIPQQQMECPPTRPKTNDNRCWGRNRNKLVVVCRCSAILCCCGWMVCFISLLLLVVP